MWKIAILVWIMLGTAVAGTAVLVVLTNQAWLARGMVMIPLAAVGGFVLAMPLAILIARKIAAPTRHA